MKVVHVEGGMHLYGGAQQVLYLLDGLRRYDCENLLVCPPTSAVAAAAVALRIPVRELALRGDTDPGSLLRLAALLRHERPDLVHLHSRRGIDVWGGLAARLTGVPCILSRRVDNPEPSIWARMKYRLYHRVVTISEGIRRVLLAEGVAADRVICVPSAVDYPRYARPCDRDWFLSEFGLPPEAQVMGVVAQLISRKGHRHLLSALPSLLQRHAYLYVLCFGQGPLRSELEQEAGQTKYQGRIRFVGFRADLERILPCLYALIHPAEMEGLGVSLLQAAAAALPIVATRVGGIPEVVRDEVNGLLVAPADVSALEHALERLLQDVSWATAMGKNGQLIVRDTFSISTMVLGNWQVYQDVLAEVRA